MSSGRVVVFTGPRQVTLEARELPSCGPGQVRIRTTRSVISTGTELADLTGPPWLRTDGREMDPQYPRQPGYCLAGVVEEVGPGVEGLAVGDRVACSAPHGTHAVRAATACHKVPDGVPDEAAALIVGLGPTVLNACRLGQPGFGEDVVVYGQGLVGQMAVLVLAQAGLQSLVAVDVSERRLALARDLGAATHYANPRATDVAAMVRGMTAGRGADVVFEATGRSESFDACIATARRFGTVVALGSPRWPAPVNLFHLHEKGVNIVGAHVSTHPPEADARHRWSRRANAELLMEWVRSGRCRLGAVITQRYPGDRAPDVYGELVADRERFLGVALEW
jgi:threonine dehydrogenase-like Zn-dependent dehydrogenase